MESLSDLYTDLGARKRDSRSRESQFCPLVWLGFWRCAQPLLRLGGFAFASSRRWQLGKISGGLENEASRRVHGGVYGGGDGQRTAMHPRLGSSRSRVTRSPETGGWKGLEDAKMRGVLPPSARSC